MVWLHVSHRVSYSCVPSPLWWCDVLRRFWGYLVTFLSFFPLLLFILFSLSLFHTHTLFLPLLKLLLPFVLRFSPACPSLIDFVVLFAYDLALSSLSHTPFHTHVTFVTYTITLTIFLLLYLLLLVFFVLRYLPLVSPFPFSSSHLVLCLLFLLLRLPDVLSLYFSSCVALELLGPPAHTPKYWNYWICSSFM